MAHVYLIHFDNKLHHAGHYLGYSTCLPHRIESHRNNTGAKLLRAVNEAGISWGVVRTWTVSSQGLEGAIKRQKNTPRFCPVCNAALAGKTENNYQEPQ